MAARRVYYIGRTQVLARLKGISVGKGSIIFPGAVVSRRGGSIVMGERCEVHRGAMILSYGGDIRIGNNCSFNPYTILYGHGGVKIGNSVRIAAHVVIIPANHGIAPDRPIHAQPLTKVGIEIGDDVWIGAQSVILDGAKIASGCVVAAGAVAPGGLVTEALGIYGGVPARKISDRNKARAPRSLPRSSQGASELNHGIPER